jgi:KDO2-lipid IV(A) lauroyltransferase
MSYLGYLLFRLWVGILSLFSFETAYKIADFLFFMIYQVFGYRKKVVIQNLKIAFPEKSEKEILEITCKFYKHLCDIILEIFKGFSISEKEIKERFTIESTKASAALLAQGKSILALTAHYNNWEWGALGAGFMIDAPMYALYKPLSNKYIDSFVRKKRKAFGVTLHPIYQTKSLLDTNLSKTPSVYILAADQSPSNIEKAHWVTFFNRPTACLHGAELYAQNPKFGVIFYEIVRLKRGYYQLRENPISYQAEGSCKGELTQKYMSLLEAEIRREPAWWLWSHRRWKHSPKANN